MAEKRTLPTERRDEAENLARQPYSVLVIRNTTDQGDLFFLAVNSELEGCIAHGKTSEEAIENLSEARKDYLQVCLLSGTMIPIPAALEEKYTSPSGNVMASTSYNLSQKEYLVAQVDQSGISQTALRGL